MIDIFRIVFQSGDFYNQESGIKDLLNTLLGSAIGSGVTVWVLYRTFRQAKVDDENKRIQFQKEKLKYFKSLTDMILSNLNSQIEYYKSFADKISLDPFELPLLQESTLNELEQIVHKINQEDYYHSYLGEFGSSTEVINEYRNLISLLNYFDGNIKMYKIGLQKSFEFDHERKIRLKNIIEKSMDETSGFIINQDIKNNYFLFWQYINQTLFNFHNLQPQPQNADLKYFHDNFIQILKAGLVPFTTIVPVAHYLAIQLKSTTFIFNDIKKQNKAVENDFRNLHLEMKTYYKKLEIATNRLMSYSV